MTVTICLAMFLLVNVASFGVSVHRRYRLILAANAFAIVVVLSTLIFRIWVLHRALGH